MLIQISVAKFDESFLPVEFHNAYPMSREQDHSEGPATFKLIPGFDPGPIPEKGRTGQQNN